MPNLSNNTLTIKLEGRDENLSVHTLLRVLKDTVSILTDVDIAISQKGRRTLKWEIVDVSLSRPLTLTIAGRPVRSQFSESAVEAMLDGLDMLESGTETPRYFNEHTIQKAKRLAATRDDGVASLVLSSRGHRCVEPTQHLAAHADAILSEDYHEEHTTLEGTLEDADTHEGYQFTIIDRLDQHGVICHFPEELFSAAKDALRKRVVVSGEATINRHGQALSLRVNGDIEIIDETTLPEFREGEGINITEGMDSGEYIRRMRDAE